MPVFEIGLDDGRKLRIEADDQESALAGVSHFQQQEQTEKPSGVIAGAREGVAQLLHGPAETAKQFFGADAAGLEDKAQKIAPTDYHGTNVVPKDTWYDPRTYNYSQLPQAAAEAAPGMVQDIAAAKLAGRVHPLLGLGAGVASYLLRTRGDAAKEDAAVRTGNADAQPETQDKVRSLATGLAESVPQAVGLGRFLPGANAVKSVGTAGAKQALKKALETSGVEAGTGAASNAISQAGATIGTDKGLSVDPSKVVESGLASGLTGAALASPRAVADVHGARKYEQFGGDNQEATTAVMNRVAQAADGQKLDTKSSFEHLRTADEGLRDELKTAVKPIKSTLDADTAAALKQAGKGRKLSDSDLSLIEENTTPDIAFLARQAHVASMVKDMGDYGGGKFVGGLGNQMEKHVRALQNPVGSAVAAGLGAMSLGGHAAALYAYGPATLGAIAGTYGGLRGIDALTGNRVPLKGLMSRFADPNSQVRLPAPQEPQAAPTPSPGPTGPKVGFDPGVTGAGALLATGQSPWTAPPEAAAKGMTPVEMNEQVKSALLMAAARRKVAAEQATANAPAPMDANGLNEQVKAALLMASARRKSAARRAALGLAADSPLIQDNGGTSLLSNPAFAKEAGSLIAGARAHQALTRTPEEEGAPGPAAPQGPAPAPTEPTAAPVAPVDPLAGAKALAKLTKKKGGQAKVEQPQPDAFEHAYEPMADEQLWGRGLQDETFASRELAKELANGKEIDNREGYMGSIVHDRTKRRNILADIASDHDEATGDVLARLLEELHHTRRAAKAHAAIQHFAAQLPPEARARVLDRLDRSYINSTWTK